METQEAEDGHTSLKGEGDNRKEMEEGDEYMTVKRDRRKAAQGERDGGLVEHGEKERRMLLSRGGDKLIVV